MQRGNRPQASLRRLRHEWRTLATSIRPTPERLTALLWNQLYQLRYGYGMGSKQVGESLRERGKAKLKSGGESHLRHRAMAIEKEVCTLSPRLSFANIPFVL